MDDIYVLHSRLEVKSRLLMSKKNHDYRGGDKDPFANFRKSEMFNVSADTGIKIRMIDKHQRIRSFHTTGLQVEDERLADTVLDCQNYTILLHAWYLGITDFEAIMKARNEVYEVAFGTLRNDEREYWEILLSCEGCLTTTFHPVYLINAYTNLLYNVERRLSGSP